jgi:hypothetical protein
MRHVKLLLKSMAAEPESLQSTIEALNRRELALLEERRKIDARLSQVRTARAALTALESDEPVEFEGGLAEAIRTALKTNADRSLVPTEVRTIIKALGYDLSAHSNPLASIHSVLKRLAESGEAKTKEWKQQPGTTRYYWNPEQQPVAAPILSVNLRGVSAKASIGAIGVPTPKKIESE